MQKLNLIRKTANIAVHDNKLIRSDAALRVLGELYHVMIWAALHHSQNPQDAPTGTRFDPQLAKKLAPLTRREMSALAQKFSAQDEAHKKQLAEHEELAAAKDAEIAELQSKVKAAQAANTQVDSHDYSEAETRDLFIDVLLAEAGWASTSSASGSTSSAGAATGLRDARSSLLSHRGESTSSASVTHEHQVNGMPSQAGTGFVDYVLWGSNGLPLALVEAKRTTKSPHVGQQQAKLYADALEAASPAGCSSRPTPTEHRPDPTICSPTPMST